MFVLRKIKKLAGSIIRILYKLTYHFISIDDKLVIFISFHGRGYSDNPRAIYEQMRKDPRFNDYRFIWFIKNHKKKNVKIEGAEIKEYLSLPYFYYMSKQNIGSSIVKCLHIYARKINKFICRHGMGLL